MPKGLVLLSDTYPPFRHDVSVLLCEELKKRGFDFDFLIQATEPLNSRMTIEWKGCRFFVAPTTRSESFTEKIQKNLWGFFNDCRGFSLVDDYDFLLIRDKFIHALPALAGAKLNGIKVFYWLSFPFPEARLEIAPQRPFPYNYYSKFVGKFNSFLLYKVLLPSAEHVFVQSQKMKEDIAERGIPEDKMTPVPMGIRFGDIPRVDAESVGVVKPEGEKWLLYQGTLERTRRLEFLIDVLEEIKKRVHYKVKLLMVGKGTFSEDDEFLKEYAINKGLLRDVYFTGFVSRDRLYAYMNLADVCLSPFYPTFILLSTSPTKLIEYMAVKKPVVANVEHPEQRQVLTESKAGLLAPWDVEKFAEACIRVMENPEEAKKMGERGRRYVEKHRTYDVIADMVAEKLYQML